MTHGEARKIFGLGPDEDPRPHLAEFRNARERIAELVRTARNDILAARYQDGLVEFDQALAAIREYLETTDLEARPPRATKPLETPAAVPADIPADVVPAPRRRMLAWYVWLLVFLAGAAGGGLLFYRNEQHQLVLRQARIALLEREGAGLVENRRWQEAARTYAEIEALAPGSELVVLGRRSIEAGMTEEQSQFVGYWTGQAIAELDAGHLDESRAAVARVLEKFPAEPAAIAILERLAVARAGQVRDAAIAAARKQLEARQWDAAITACQQILATAPDHAAAQAILADATTALEQHAADQAKAKSLLEQATARDHGQYDSQALDWLREALALAPDNPEISARLEKMASYTRTLRVPDDFATPAAALAAARNRDRIVLGEQTWKGPLVVNAAIDLQGAGSAKTIVECPATEGNAITLGPDAKGARVSGITFRHESFHALGNDRFSAALVRGGGRDFHRLPLQRGQRPRLGGHRTGLGPHPPQPVL